MLKTLSQYFKGFIAERVEEIDSEIVLNNRRYLELTSRIIETQYALKENLSSGSQGLVNNYDEAEAERSAILAAIMYRRGLLDGVKLAKVLGRFGVIHKFMCKWLP
jgi:hypothetical protein